ncbi:MAG: TRAP transporter large permease subunit [Burkholderiales bacterium]
MNSLGTVWIFALVFLICADIVGRAVFNRPLEGVPEMVAYSLVGIVFLQLASTLQGNRLIRAEFFLDVLGRTNPRVAAGWNAVIALLGLAVMSVIIRGTWPLLERAWGDDEVMGVPGSFVLVLWPLRFVVVFGALVTAIEFGALLIDAGRSMARVLRAATEGSGFVVWVLLVACAILAWSVIHPAVSDVSGLFVGATMLVAMFLLIVLGVPIAIALVIPGFVGIWLLKGNLALPINAVALASNSYIGNYYFASVPLFVMMGLLVSASDIGRETFQVAQFLLSRLRGGLGIATVAANAVFAAVTGSSIASAAVFTKVATPEMMRHGYNARFSVGVVAGSSVLGMLIPPSVLLIVYGFLAEQSVGHLFLAATVPGIILAVAFSIAIWAIARWRPQLIGTVDAGRSGEVAGVGDATRKVTPIVLLIVVVMGGIYGGAFTATEAGAVGALGAGLIALVRRRVGWSTLWRVLEETGHISVSILFLVLAANIYARMLALSGLPQAVSDGIAQAGLGFAAFMALYLLLVIILGMFLDSVSIMLIVVPLALPAVQALGGNAIWFGVVTVIAVEIGLLTPPLGIACFVVHSTLNDPRISLADIFIGAIPFTIVMTLVTILLVAVPKLSLLFI